MFKTVLILSALPLLLTFLVTDCARRDRNINEPGDEQNRRMKSVPKGTWGGEHIQLEVSEQGGQVEYDCAHGSIDQKLVLDAQGRFKVTGTHVHERGGPTRKGEGENGHPAQFSGQITGNKMTLKVTETDSGESLGEFNLTYGQTPRLMKCK
jgi:hypothetical protein